MNRDDPICYSDVELDAAWIVQELRRRGGVWVAITDIAMSGAPVGAEPELDWFDPIRELGAEVVGRRVDQYTFRVWGRCDPR